MSHVMNERHRWALAHPLEDATDHAARDACRLDDVQRDGNLIRSILAVDR